MTQGYTNLGCQIAMAINFVRRCLIVIGPEYGTYSILPFWSQNIEVSPTLLENV